jgi:hypothetical protein
MKMKKLQYAEIKWIMENDFKFHPESSLEDQTEILMEYLGSPDTNLREGSLDILTNWIMMEYYSNEKLIEMADRLADNILEGLGKKKTDTVFLRAFAALTLATIINYDEQCALKNDGTKAFLSEDLVKKYFEKSIKYYNGEKDIRGYIEGKEWAHSIAHGADLLKNFARCRYIQKDDLLLLLETIGDKITEPFEDVYGYYEDLRISITVYTVFMRNLLTIEEIETWFQKMVNKYFEKRWFDYVKDISKRNGLMNTRMFFYSFYAMVKFGISKERFRTISYYEKNILDFRDPICKKIEEILHRMASGFFA